MFKNWMIISGTYGVSMTQCTLFIYKNPNDQSYWYCIKGSRNVNYTYDYLQPGVNVELVEDIDCFTSDSEIETIDQLIKAVEE